MQRCRLLVLGLIVCLPRLCQAEEKNAPESLQLTLPTEFYAVAGVECGVYFENLVLTPAPEMFLYEVECPLGDVEKQRWVLTPQAEQQGSYPWKIRIKNAAGETVAQGATTLRIFSDDHKAAGPLRLLIVGDSLTNATVYPNEIARLLSLSPQLKWEMFGTNRSPRAAPGVGHEGYGGWTWQRFASLYDPEADPADRQKRSPFVFASEAGKPQLDLARYFQQECGGQQPDVIIFLLGINDCFSADPENPAPRIEAMFQSAETVLQAFRRAAPDAKIGFCLTTPGNSRDAAFDNNYKGKYTRWGWKRIQHQLIQRQLDWAVQQPDDNLFIIPTQLHIDPTNGFPSDNAVHPNATGYKQIGQTIYAWLKSQSVL